MWKCNNLLQRLSAALLAFALAGSALLLFLLVGWLLLGYYRRELQTVQSELQRHEQAIPILQAYAASDAMLCDGHLCVNTDATDAAVRPGS